jgi:DnaJ-class molecular chaperone
MIICRFCDGSGLGRFDYGSRCRHCKGEGIENIEEPFEKDEEE